MRKFAIPAISLAALMASGIAFAQTTPEQPAQNQPSQQDCTANPALAGCPAQPNAQQDGTTTTQPTDQSQTDQSSEQPKTTVSEQPATPPADGVLVVTDIDAKNAMLASNFIGSSVYTAANENIGDINDVVFDSTGAVKAVIIGVGGFLGMGEKDVAVPLAKITMSRDESNAVKLMITASREELEAAPAFDKTLFVVKAPAAPGTTTQPEATTTQPDATGTGTGSGSSTTQQ